MPRLLGFSIYCVFTEKKNNEMATASLNQYVQMHSEARDITQFLEKHDLLSSHI